MSDGLPMPESHSLLRPILLTCTAFLLLYGRSLIAPVFSYDDFQILPASRTWQRTYENLWVPQNEHAMPLGRIYCFALESLAPRLTVLPFWTALAGPAALLLGLWLLYVFVRRELGHPFYALLVVVLFAVTSVYNQAVWWFAASFAILSLDTLLLGLLAAQRWRQSGRGVYLALCILACFLAPGWFALGVLAGPLCCLYLLPTVNAANRAAPVVRLGSPDLPPAPMFRLGSPDLPPVGAASRAGPCGSGSARRPYWHWTFSPLVGTALFLAISLPRTAEAILHTGHYGKQTAVQAFDPWIGLAYTVRSLVDNLLLGVLGVCGVALPIWVVAPVLAVLVVLGVWWWRQATERRLMLLGLGLIGSTYMLCYSARALWDYEQMVTPAFSRYHLLPHLGLVLFVVGGLPGRWFTLESAKTMTARQQRWIYTLIGICFVVQLPRGLLCGSPTGWSQFEEVRAQQAVLSRIEEVDARCRRYHIAADDARQALGILDVPLSLGVADGWDFLIGSDDPRPLPPEEVKRLLEAP
jgi:hypothetical protein